MSDFDSKAFMSTITAGDSPTAVTLAQMPASDMLILYGASGEGATDGTVTINGVDIPVPVNSIIQLNRADGKYIVSSISNVGITVVAIA